MRNRIVHEYGNVDLTIVYDTVKKDIPELIGILEGICRCKKNKKFPDSEMQKETSAAVRDFFIYCILESDRVFFYKLLQM